MSTKAERTAAAVQIVEDLAKLGDLTGLQGLKALVPIHARAKALVHDMKTAEWGFTDAVRSRSIGSRQAAAEDSYAVLFPIFRRLVAEGKSYQDIQDHLNANAVPSATGRPWRKGMVWHIRKVMLERGELPAKGVSRDRAA